MDNDFKAAADMMVANAPEDWFKLSACYKYFDGAMALETFYIKQESPDWEYFNYYDDDLLDFFDDYRDKNHAQLDNPWSVITLTVNADQSIGVEFGYGDPDVLGVRG